MDALRMSIKSKIGCNDSSKFLLQEKAYKINIISCLYYVKQHQI